VLAHGSAIKAVAMILLGLLIGIAGTDTQSGIARFTFGVPELYDGVDFVPVAMGLFGFAEIMSNLDRGGDKRTTTAEITSLWPNREEIRRAIPAVLRGTSIGSFLGLLPGGGAVLASFAAYTLEKKVSRHAAEFGKGAVEGVAGPESANNAGAQTSFIPLLTLGIPSTPVMALMMGAMTIQGIAPGTAIITERPLLFWGMIASMWIGNLMLVIINLPLIGIWVSLLKVPYRILFPCILVFCCVGAYSINNSTFLIMMMAGFALLGYVFHKLGCEGAPFLLGFVLGPLMEENLRRSMVLSFGDPSIFVQRPISLVILLLTLGLVLLIIAPQFRQTREEAFQEETYQESVVSNQNNRALITDYWLPHTSRVTSTISRSLAISSSMVMVLPPIPLEKPHCGLSASCSSGTNLAASSMRRLRSSLLSSLRSLVVMIPSTAILPLGMNRSGSKPPARALSYSR
jgi:putative tricarboxylic transport membrane protein